MVESTCGISRSSEIQTGLRGDRLDRTSPENSMCFYLKERRESEEGQLRCEPIKSDRRSSHRDATAKIAALRAAPQKASRETPPETGPAGWARPASPPHAIDSSSPFPWCRRVVPVFFSPDPQSPNSGRSLEIHPWIFSPCRLTVGTGVQMPSCRRPIRPLGSVSSIGLVPFDESAPTTPWLSARAGGMLQEIGTVFLAKQPPNFKPPCIASVAPTSDGYSQSDTKETVSGKLFVLA